jgi:transcriptional regulator with XRE-family HTH domain
MPQVAANIIAARQAAGLTQEQLARDVHVSLRTVQAWEGGETDAPHGRNLIALAKRLGKDNPAWIYFPLEAPKLTRGGGGGASQSAPHCGGRKPPNLTAVATSAGR